MNRPYIKAPKNAMAHPRGEPQGIRISLGSIYSKCTALNDLCQAGADGSWFIILAP
jgi:hypothetical protein